MAARRLSVSKLQEILRFKGLGLSDRQIAQALKCSRHTIKKYLAPLAASPAVETQAKQPGAVHWAEALDWNELIAEAKRGVPLQVLWEELREGGKLTVSYPGFWKQLRKRCPNLQASMHRVFEPGERVEIDYCDGIPIVDPLTGDRHVTQLFVGVLCQSRYTFAEFSLTQRSHDFLSSHVRMFEFFGGVPQVLAPDNLKSAVTKAHRYDPEINPAYTKLAAHYDVAVVPARVRRPKDKAIVERSVQIFQRWFYYRVRKRTFTSLRELNECLATYLVDFNAKEHRIFRRSRREMYEGERASLRPLPDRAFLVATSRQAKLHPDCHLLFDHNFYSAPYQHRAKVLTVWATAHVVELFDGLERVAVHARATGTGKFRTNPKHYPPAQRAYAETTPSWLRDEARRIGPETAEVVVALLSGPTPLRYIRRAQGIVRLEKTYGRERLESACRMARGFGRSTCRYIEGLLKRKREAAPVESQTIQRGRNPHLRGKELFH